MTWRVHIGVALLFCAITVLADDQTASELTSNQAKGRALFNESCVYCHGERGHATTLLRKRLGTDDALLEHRTNLTPELVRHAVRHGINSMPWYRRAELSDRDLESIADYLTRSKVK